MAFINNPLISSLASSVGLGALTTGGADPAVASATPTPKVAPKASAPNQPEYKQARFFDPRSPQGSRGSAPSGMPSEPGAMSPDVQNNPTVMDLLNHFGVHPQQQIDPGLFIHNAAAWQNHPVMSGVLDGLMSGLANTKGSDTAGEGLSNVAQGLEATHDQKIQHMNAQLMMPYNQAMAVANLQDQVGKQTLQEAQQKDALAHASYFSKLNDTREDIAQTAADGKARVAQIGANSKALLASVKPPNMKDDEFKKVSDSALAKITGGRDLSQAPATPEEYSQAALEADRSIRTMQGNVAANTAGATAKAKLPAQIALKGATPGSSNAAMISATKNGDAQAKASYQQALKDYTDYANAKDPSKKGALTGKLFVLPGSPEDVAELGKRKAALDAATRNLPGPYSSKPAAAPDDTKYSPNNPFRKKNNAYN